MFIARRRGLQRFMRILGTTVSFYVNRRDFPGRIVPGRDGKAPFLSF